MSVFRLPKDLQPGDISINHGLWPGPNYNLIEQIMKDHMEKAAKKKDDFIKSKIIEKGYGHLLEGIEKRIFPKIVCIRDDSMPTWIYYYADNNTDEGDFIVAIQDYTFDTNTDPNNFGVMMNCSFKWQDTEPLKITRKNMAE